MTALRKDLRAITADGAAANIMVGIGENYLPAFVLALTASQVACGLTPTVPMLVGAVLQLAAPAVIRRLGSYRRWVVFCAAVQAIVFLPLMATALAGQIPLAVVFATISLYWATGLAGGPAWNTWVATLIPDRLRARFLARRTRMAQAGLLLGFLLGGLALQAGSHIGAALAPFAVLFLVAAGSRAVSAWFLARQSEPSPPRQTVAVAQEARRKGAKFTAHPLGRVLAYMLFIQVAVQISGPYFTPYMLCQLKLSYIGYVVLTCSAYAAKIAFLPLAGRMAARWGSRRLLLIGGLAITPTSALWLASDSFGYLVAVQVWSGVAWAVYELGMLLVFVGAIPAEQRVRVLTLYNLGNASAILLGSLLGGAVLALCGEVREIYMLLFAVSGIVRVSALLVFLRVPSLRRHPKPVRSPAPAPVPVPMPQPRPAIAFGRAIVTAAIGWRGDWRSQPSLQTTRRTRRFGARRPARTGRATDPGTCK